MHPTFAPSPLAPRPHPHPAENLDVLLKGRTPVGERMLPIPSAPAALGGGAPRHRRSRSVELPEALLGRPGSPFLHKVERPTLKLRPGGRPAAGAVAATAASGLAFMERSHSSPVLLQQQQRRQQERWRSRCPPCVSW